jgi:lysophospholipase L1-like esterase
VLVKDVPRLDSPGGWSTSTATGASNTTLAIYNAQVSGVAAEFGGVSAGVAVADPTPGWDIATLSTSTDSKHPNDHGHAVYANAIQQAINSLGYSAGWNTL